MSQHGKLWYFYFAVPTSPRSPVSPLRTRKRQFVRNEIWDTAMDLFAAKGFDATTVDDIAQAAGVSRRSFFRYFSSKNDLMAQGILAYGTVVTQTIDRCPRSDSPAAVLRGTVLEVAQQSAAHPRARMVMQIAAKYPAAREAQLSRFGEVQERVAEAYARRAKGGQKGDLTPRVLASLTLGMIDVILQSWFEDGRQDIAATANQVFTTSGQLLAKTLRAGG